MLFRSEGGMANVYLAQDTILERKVAVKVLRGDLASDEKFVRRFQREALAASSLNHPNVVQMYDVGEDDGNFYIVMEYIEGRTLKQLIKKRGKLTFSEVVDIMLQLTEGMSHAHDAYIACIVGQFMHQNYEHLDAKIIYGQYKKNYKKDAKQHNNYGFILNSMNHLHSNSDTGEVIWDPNQIGKIKSCFYYKDVYVTKKLEQNSGTLFNVKIGRAHV